jgi:HAD superfamily hydrolase (TIGR01509 family)
MSVNTVHQPELSVGSLHGVRAAVFDFNGTMTDDEHLQYQVYAETFLRETGIRVTREAFESVLSGLPDRDMLKLLFARHGRDLPSPRFVARFEDIRLRQYVCQAGRCDPIRAEVAEFVRAMGAAVPLSVVTGAPPGEVLPVLEAAGLLDLFETVVTCEEVTHGKPDPEGFLLALSRMRAVEPDLRPRDVVVFEDSAWGVTAAGRAGMRCVATYLRRPDDGCAADLIADRLEPALLGVNHTWRV